MFGSWSTPRVRCLSAARTWILAMTCKRVASKSPTQTPPHIAPAAKASPPEGKSLSAKHFTTADYADDSDISENASGERAPRAQRRDVVVGQAFLPATAS